MTAHIWFKHRMLHDAMSHIVFTEWSLGDLSV